MDQRFVTYDEFRRHKHDNIETDALDTPTIDLTDDVTGTLPVANGGTGAATHTDGGLLIGKGTAAFANTGVLGSGTIVIGDGTTDPTTLAAFTSPTGTLKHEYGGIETDISGIAKGALLVGTAAGVIGIKAVGTDTQVLTADAAATGGIKWATPTVDAVDKLYIQTTDVTVANTTTETDIFTSYTLAGGTLSTNNSVHIQTFITSWDSDGNGNSVDFKLKYGGSTLATLTLEPGTTGNMTGWIDAYITSDGATNDQNYIFIVDCKIPKTTQNPTGSPEGVYDRTVGDSAIDSTSDQALVISADWNIANANNTITFGKTIITKIA